MKAISLFSGSGGFEIGFDRAGIQTLLQAEKDPWCRSVLERRWPGVVCVDDVRKVDQAAWTRRCRDVERERAGADTEWFRDEWSAGDAGAGVDLVYGGFPCQDVSVAGKRAGLSGERSGLWHEFRRVLRELRPQWTVIENVPGLLSSNRGRDFLTLLLGLEELGYGWAYRVVDARWFGVPQRRRRVLVVGCLGDGGAERAAQVLAVCEGCGGHPAPGREAGQDVAYSLAASTRGTGDQHGNAWNSTYVPEAWSTKLANTRSNQAGKFYEEYTPSLAHNSPPPAVAGTLGGVHHGIEAQQAWTNRLVAADPEGISRPLVARESGYRMDLETENFVLATNGSDVQINEQPGALSTRQNAGHADYVVASTFGGGEVDGTAPSLVSGDGPNGRSTHNGMDVVLAATLSGGGHEDDVHLPGRHREDDENLVAFGLRASDGHHGHSSPRGDGADNLIAWDDRNQAAVEDAHHTLRGAGLQRSDVITDVADPISTTEGKTYTHKGKNNFRTHNLLAGVRRLTPLECERLMGWPDEHTKYTADGKEIPDSHRYRMCGNGVVAPVAEWLGHRLVLAEAYRSREENHLPASQPSSSPLVHQPTKSMIHIQSGIGAAAG